MTVANLSEKFKDCSDVKGKIRRELKLGSLVRVRRGLYETNPNANGEWLAGSICGPSYLSHDYVLCLYDLIPESVLNNYTSMTHGKGKRMIVNNVFGSYRYRDVPEEAYPLGLETFSVEGYTYSMATLEKAVCDKLYTMPEVTGADDMRDMLFEDLRFDEDDFFALDASAMKEYAAAYRCANLDALIEFLEREGL